MRDELNALMACDDADFVRGAYRLILRREADAAGEKNFYTLLRGGQSRPSVLAALAESPEAKGSGKDVPGLARALRWHRIGRIRLLGPIALMLRRLARPVQDVDPTLAFRNEMVDLQRATHEMASHLLVAVRDLQVRQASLERALARMDRRQSEARRLRG